MHNYLIRRAINDSDDLQLKSLYAGVFLTEDVGGLAEILYHHYPGMKKEYWCIAEDPSSSAAVSALALIPWTWEMDGIRLKTAEMGMVGTHEEHRGRGLQKLLNREFDQILQEEQFDLAVIQGIPGFYHKFGYHYSVALENHINVPFQVIPDFGYNKSYSFRLAGKKDIPFLMREDKKYRNSYLLSSLRTEEHWEYIFSQGPKTDCASEFWIMQHKATQERHYFRIVFKGFGTGLIVSEVSEDMPEQAVIGALNFCRQKASELKKSYIRLNIHSKTGVAQKVFSMGVSDCKSYAWQIKIPDKIRFLAKLKPILEERISSSEFSNFTGKIRLNLYSECIDMHWSGGRLESVSESSNAECRYTLCISNDLFPALVLGHRSWEELQYIRPDTAPELLYLLPTKESLADRTGALAGALFPKAPSWIYWEY